MTTIVRNRTRGDRARNGRGQTGRTTTAMPPLYSGEASGLPMLRTSERGTFKRCRWKWYMEFHELRKPIVDVPPLRFGTIIHAALATRYRVGVRRGPHPRPIFEAMFEQNLHETAKEYKMSPHEIEEHPKWLEHRELGIAMLDNYIEHYGKDDEWEVLATEFPFQVAVLGPKARGLVFYYVGTIDGVWRNRRTKRIVIPDHKTTAAINTGYLSMDPQATAYWTWGFDSVINKRLVPPTTKLDGMLFNFLRKAKADERPYTVEDGRKYFLNKPTAKEKKEHGADYPGSISKSQPAPYFARVPIYRDYKERERAKQTIIAEWKEMEMVHGGLLQPVKNPGQFTCPGCWLLDICELHEIGADYKEMMNATTKLWNPYSAHEIREAR